MILRALTLAIASLVVAAGASATPMTSNLLQNGEFETSNVTDGNYAYANGFHAQLQIANWNFVGGTGVANHAGPWGGQGALETVAFLQNYAGFNPNSPSISQTFTSLATNLLIRFQAAQRPGNTESVAVLLDGNAIGATLTPGSADWTNYTLSASNLGSGQHVLSFQGVNGTNAYDSSLFLDSVTVAAVPEPATYAMLLLGLGMFGFMAQRRKER